MDGTLPAGSLAEAHNFDCQETGTSLTGESCRPLHLNWQSKMCGCGSVACTQCAKGEGEECREMGRRQRGLSLRVKRDERVGFGGWKGWM